MTDAPSDPTTPESDTSAPLDESVAAAATPTTDEAVGALEEPAEMTAEERAEAKRYGDVKLRCDLADRAIDVVYLAVMAVVVARPLTNLLAGYSPYDTLTLVMLFLVVFIGHECVSLPLSFYSGFVLERRYGLSRLTARGWLVRHFKRYGLSLAFSLVMFVALFWLVWWTGPWWWLVAALAFFAVSVILGQLAPVLILPLFYKVERLEDTALQERFDRLCEGTTLSIEGVYRMDLSVETVKANAALAGLGRTRRVLLGDTLLEHFTPDEIEVVFAHEVGHHVFGHIRKMMLAGLVYSAVGFWLCNVVLLRYTGLPAFGPGEAALPVYALPMLMLLLTLFGMVVEPLQNFISRGYERQCDRYALERTGMAAAYRSAFGKLARLNKDDPEPNPIAVALFESHPPIAERIAVADKR
ncbi:MAG: M48 family metallopeptidase [Pirellulales bacterium]